MIGKMQSYISICGQTCENRKVKRGINSHYDVWCVVEAFGLASEVFSFGALFSVCKYWYRTGGVDECSTFNVSIVYLSNKIAQFKSIFCEYCLWWNRKNTPTLRLELISEDHTSNLFCPLCNKWIWDIHEQCMLYKRFCSIPRHTSREIMNIDQRLTRN